MRVGAHVGQQGRGGGALGWLRCLGRGRRFRVDRPGIYAAQEGLEREAPDLLGNALQERRLVGEMAIKSGLGDAEALAQGPQRQSGEPLLVHQVERGRQDDVSR